METGNFYIIEDNKVVNIIVADEQYAKNFNLKRSPINTDFGTVDIDWIYLPQENTFLPPPRDILAEWVEVRNLRNSYLIESDLYVMPDRWATYNQDEQYAWSSYRKALRDIPQKFIDPKEIVWPQKPWVESMESIKPSEIME